MMVSASNGRPPPAPNLTTTPHKPPQTPKEPCCIKTATVTNRRRIIRTPPESGTTAYAGARTATPTKPSKDQVHHPCPNNPRQTSSIDRIPASERHDPTRQENPEPGSLSVATNSHNTPRQQSYRHHSISQTTPMPTTCGPNNEELLLPTDLSLLLKGIQTIVERNIRIIEDFRTDTHQCIKPSPSNQPNTTDTIDAPLHHSPAKPAIIKITAIALDTRLPATDDNCGPTKLTVEARTATSPCKIFQAQPRTPNTNNKSQQQNTNQGKLHTLPAGCAFCSHVGHKHKNTDIARQLQPNSLESCLHLKSVNVVEPLAHNASYTSPTMDKTATFDTAVGTTTCDTRQMMSAAGSNTQRLTLTPPDGTTPNCRLITKDIRRALQPLADDIFIFSTTVNLQATALWSQIQCLLFLSTKIYNILVTSTRSSDGVMNPYTLTMRQHWPIELLALKQEPNTPISIDAASKMQHPPPPRNPQQSSPLSLPQQHQNTPKPPRADAPTTDCIELPKCLPHKTQSTTQQDCNIESKSRNTPFQHATHTTTTAAADRPQTPKIPYDRKEFPRPPEMTHVTEPYLPPTDTDHADKLWPYFERMTIHSTTHSTNTNHCTYRTTAHCTTYNYRTKDYRKLAQQAFYHKANLRPP